MVGGGNAGEGRAILKGTTMTDDGNAGEGGRVPKGGEMRQTALTGNVWRGTWNNLDNRTWTGWFSSDTFTDRTIAFASVGEASPDDSGKVLGEGTITIHQVAPNNGRIYVKWTIEGYPSPITVLMDFLIFPSQE